MDSDRRPRNSVGKGIGSRSPRYLPVETTDSRREARRFDNGILAFDRRALDEARRYVAMVTAAARWDSARALELSRQLLDARHQQGDDGGRD